MVLHPQTNGVWFALSYPAALIIANRTLPSLQLVRVVIVRSPKTNTWAKDLYRIAGVGKGGPVQRLDDPYEILM